MKPIRYWFYLLVITWLLAACTAPGVTPAPTPIPPTLTSVPATPTRFLIPTRTPIPTVDPQALIPGQYSYAFTSEDGTQVRYLLYLPGNFDPAQKWPLILFLHGSGETGGNLEQLRNAYLPQLLETRADLPFLIVSPQLPSGEWGDFVEPLQSLLAHLENTLPVDPGREYLTGLSWGGFGTWAYALKYPQRFAAIAPVAGGYILQSPEVPSNICDLKDLPIWVFHGEQDDNVKPYQARNMVDALERCGGDPDTHRFTLYPDAAHAQTWLNAYNDPALYEWFLSHTKTPRP